jgi:hypothetical protein
MSGIDPQVNDQSRRSFMKEASYVAPLILTLQAEPLFASHGSGSSPKGNNGVSNGPNPHAAKGNKGNKGVGNGPDPQPPGNPPVNDGPGTHPGAPARSHQGSKPTNHP